MELQGAAPARHCAACGRHRHFARFQLRAQGNKMPALYKFPPHPLCPGIQFKQLNPYLEDEPPPCSEPPLRDSPSAGAESARVSPLPMRGDPHSHHGAPAAGAHHEAAARANGSHSSVSFEKPHKESRRQRERELSGLELKIPYSMARVPECTITSSGIHVRAIAVFAQSSHAVQLPARCTRAPWAPQSKDCALPVSQGYLCTFYYFTF